MEPVTPTPQRGRPTLIFAPLRGVTDDALRASFHRHFGGLDRAVAPFLTPTGRGGPRETEIRRAARAQVAAFPAVPQILSSDAADFLHIATRLADAGCTEVNWNLGCPHPPVVRRRRGAGMLPHPDQIEAFLDAVIPTSPLAVSVKMRLGQKHPDEAIAVLEVLNRYPLVEAIIHARVATQMYGGAVDLEAFARCCEVSNHHLAYNGDIVDVVGFRELEVRFPTVRRWMIGRGALSDPFLPGRIKGIEPEDGVSKLRRFHDDLYAEARHRLGGPGHALNRMKGLWLYLGTATGAETRLLKKLKKVRSFDRYEKLVDQIFREV